MNEGPTDNKDYFETDSGGGAREFWICFSVCSL